MARPVYSVVLLEGTLTNADELNVDLPAGFIYVVRDIQIVGNTNTGYACTLVVAINDLIIWRDTVPDIWYGALQWQGRCVAPGPSTITAASTGGSCSWNVTISGYQLSTP